MNAIHVDQVLETYSPGLFGSSESHDYYHDYTYIFVSGQSEKV